MVERWLQVSVLRQMQDSSHPWHTTDVGKVFGNRESTI
jgi:hypothetical protein